MGGWFDPFLPSLLADWSSVRGAEGPGAESRLRLGAWAHTYPIRMARGRMPTSFRIEALRPAVPWFDRHLEARGRRGELDTVVVRYWMMGRDEWREDVSWPPSRMHETAYYMSSGGRANSRRGDGRMSLQPPAAAGAEDRFLHDPSRPVPTRGGAMLGPRAGVFRQDSLEDRDDVLVYTTEPLERDLEIAGPVRLRLHVSTDAPSADFTAKLVDVHPDDSAWNVCDGILRRDFDPKPGGGACPPAEIEIELWPTAMAFLRGHRVRLEVASSNFPRFDRNPGTGRTLATETEKHPARQTVYHDAARPSRLILPVLSP
jgi:putative CocE/NonD family hydrolase